MREIGSERGRLENSGDSSNLPSAAAVSEMLLVLYELARTPSVQDFLSKAFDAMSEVIAFDIAIHGIGVLTAEGRQITAAYTRQLPENAADLINSSDRSNVIDVAIFGEPGKVHVFSYQDILDKEVDLVLWKELGDTKQVLCYNRVDEELGLFSFLLIARKTENRAFALVEHRWIELLAPHVEAMLGICRVSELQQLRLDSNPPHTRSAVCDARGVLQAAEPGFADLMGEGWPKWKGPNLPSELIKGSFCAEISELANGPVIVSMKNVAQDWLVTVSRRSPVDLLTIQEQTVARAFAQGLSYKEVARVLGRSPATVRHHLRSIYVKLDVRDKGALSRAIFGIAETEVQLSNFTQAQPIPATITLR